MILVQQIKDMDQEKTKCKEESIQQLLHQMILLGENKEWIVDKDPPHQTKHKSLLIEDLKIKDSHGKEVQMLIIKCLQLVIRDLCNHKMRYLQSRLDQIQAKIINLYNQKEQVQETQSVANQ